MKRRITDTEDTDDGKRPKRSKLNFVEPQLQQRNRKRSYKDHAEKQYVTADADECRSNKRYHASNSSESTIWNKNKVRTEEVSIISAENSMLHQLHEERRARHRNASQLPKPRYFTPITPARPHSFFEKKTPKQTPQQNTCETFAALALENKAQEASKTALNFPSFQIVSESTNGRESPAVQFQSSYFHDAPVFFEGSQSCWGSMDE